MKNVAYIQNFKSITDEQIIKYMGDIKFLTTKKEVLHAESNALAKLAKSNESGENATLFITHSPCMECAKLIYQSGIRNVYFNENYRDESGIDFLTKSGVNVNQFTNTVQS